MIMGVLSEGGPLAVAVGMAVWVSGKWTNHKVQIEKEKDDMMHTQISGQIEVLHKRHDKMELKMDSNHSKLEEKLDRLLSRD
jgi:hypothetical protein